MRLRSLRIENVRGIKELDLDLDEENFAISGPNGSGKSGVVDALDFLLTGSISRLQGEATGDVSILEHGLHIDCDDPDNARVKAALVTFEGDEVVIERSFSSRGMCSVSDTSYKGRVENLLEAARQGFHVLTRGDILNFIFVTPGKRGEKVESLLRLEDVDPVRRSLNRAADQLEGAADLEQSKLDTAADDLRDLVGADGKPLEIVLQHLEECRRYLGADAPVDVKVEEEVSFRDGLTSPVGTLPESPLRSELTRGKLQTLKKWHEERREQLVKELREFLEEVAKLQDDEGAVRELRTGELIELGLETLREEDEECPLCLTQWEYSHLHELLSERKKRLKSAQKRRERLQSTKSDFLRSLSELSGVVGAVAEACRQDDGVDSTPVIDLEAEISDLEDLLTQSVLAVSNPSIKAESLAQRFATSEMDDWIESVENRIEQLTDYEPLEELWEVLRDASRLYNNLQEHERKAAEFTLAARDARSVAEHFNVARKNVLNDVYDSVSGKMAEYYEAVHAPDEAGFSVELDPKETGLDLRVPFYNRGMHPPQALHSEGHQDTMGLCLYLALHNELASDAIQFTILDDVISSVDASHRRGVVDLLDIQSESLQLFVTTHDDVFLNHLRSKGVIRRSQSRRFTGWDIQTGPHDDASLADPWARIDQLIVDGDVSGAAARLRRTGEWFLREAAGRLGAFVRYKPDHRWSLGDFVGPLLDRFSNLTKDAKKAADSWGRDTTEIDDYNRERKAVYGAWFSESGDVNPNVHYREDDWASYTPKELEKVVHAYRSLYELLRCSTCGAFARVIYDDHKAVQVVCSCRSTFDWSLESKL